MNTKLFGLNAALCKRKVLCGVKHNATTSTKQKRADLQGLRGVAILFVLLMHLKPNSYRLGFVGVDIFFVLSGFLMAKILLEKKLTLWSVWYFYSRRFKRIVPLYMLFVVSVYIFGYFYVLRFDRKQILDDLTWAYTYSSNLQPIFQKLGYWDQLSTYRFFVHAWSLGVELQYYLIVPFIMGLALCLEHNARIILFLTIGVFSVIFQLYAPPKVSYGFLVSRIWQFMCGSIAYEFSKPFFSKDKSQLRQEEKNSLENAYKQGKIKLSYEGMLANVRELFMNSDISSSSQLIHSKKNQDYAFY
ncbi:unnamed protein product [Cylicocyclus nassatus]|uniref:Acyltransferase 3 domain-containing protein n=1 Tax=Cylicocyclus nassatus TaxID=53992 RepID=A0AA36H6M0_CYLNA|nr:unnamed protein product [Cylicocyclus nassatus]